MEKSLESNIHQKNFSGKNPEPKPLKIFFALQKPGAHGKCIMGNPSLPDCRPCNQ